MSRKVKTPPRTSAKSSADLSINEFSTFALEEDEDNRILKTSLWFAVGLHLILLMINFPKLQSESLAEPEEKQIWRVLPTPRFNPPPIPKATIPPKKVKKVPMPDPTPDEPEPLPLEEKQVELELPEVDEDFFILPDAPPAPPMPEGPIAVGGEVTKPVKIHGPQPEYTEIARRVKLEGVVVVQAIINKNGDVTDVKVLKHMSMGLSEASVAAIRQWKFKPATLRGKPVDVYYSLTVNFSLQ